MGYVLGLSAAILFGCNGVLIKVLLQSGISAAELTFLRAFCTMCLSGIILLISDRKSFRVSRGQLVLLAILGIGGVVGLQFFYAIAVSRLSVGIALLFEYLVVIAVAVIARFIFKERLKRRIWVAVVCVLSGLALVAEVWDSKLEVWGMVAGILAAVSYTVYFVLGERVLLNLSVLGLTFWSMLFASIFWIAMGTWGEIETNSFLEIVSMTGSLSWIEIPLWIPLLYAIVIGSFVPTLLSFAAIQRLRATPAGIIASSEVIVAFFIAWLWLNETLNLFQILGSAIVIVGVALAQTSRQGKVIDLDLATGSVRTINSKN